MTLATAAGLIDSLTLTLNNPANPTGGIPTTGVVIGGSGLAMNGTTPGQVETLNIVSAGSITTTYNSVTLASSGSSPYITPNIINVSGSQGLTLNTGVLAHSLTVNGSGTGGLVFNSLLGEVLLWILTLLMLVWGVSVIMTYQVADGIADQPYDEDLGNKVRALGSLLVRDGDKVALRLPAAAREVLVSDARDQVYYEVTTADGRAIAGNLDIPWVELPRSAEPGNVGHYDADINDEEIRVAYSQFVIAGSNEQVLVQVAETRKKRLGLVASIVSGVIVPQFVMVPLAVLLVYIGFTRGITPLQRLQEELRQRRPIDLSPINVKGLPEEVRPLIEALNDVMARLEHTLGSQRRFIADAAHQLKTPLTGLRTQTELALRESGSEAMRENLNRVAASAENLSHLTHQLLSLARAEAGVGLTAKLELLDLDVMAREAATEWADHALAKGIDLGYEPAEHPVRMLGITLLLHEAVVDLIDNAIKYTPRGGQVTIRARQTDLACIEVEDTGPGISPEEREKIFERFYRILGSGIEGSGLGLAIVQETAELFAGRVDIEPGRDGRGSLFRMSFPVANSRPMIPVRDE